MQRLHMPGGGPAPDDGPGSGPHTARRGVWARLGWGHRGFRAHRRGAHVALLLILLLPFLADMYLALVHGPQAAYADYGIFLRAARAFDEDPAGPIYRTCSNFLYPPFFLTLIRPLVWLPPHVGIAVFQLAKWAALYVTLRLAWRLCAPPGEDVPPIVALGSLVLVWRYLANDMLNGNINMFIVAGVLAAAWLALRGRHSAAGFLVGLLVCLKVTPGLLLLYFLWKGWWRTLPGAVLALIVGLVLWPAASIGWAQNLRLLHEWYDHIIGGYVAAGAVYSVGTNQGLVALLNRLFGAEIAFEPDRTITLVRLPAGVLAALRTVLTAGLLGVLLWNCRVRRGLRPPALAWAAEVALVQVAMLVLSGYTWKAHYVAMVLPYSVLLAYLADARYPRALRPACASETLRALRAPRAWVARLLVASALLMLLSAELFGPRVADYLLAYGVVLYSGLAAGAALILVRRALATAEQAAPAPSRNG